ncbi:unnamed protein product [Periconia digitata]|uniref:Uncharacterized protein n=1 Tax=Periconia digitata TaxID=1303443 RepID=A0A9W4UUU8_9PLEO|nr:unnamed protein product [Periconia digitata]
MQGESNPSLPCNVRPATPTRGGNTPTPSTIRLQHIETHAPRCATTSLLSGQRTPLAGRAVGTMYNDVRDSHQGGVVGGVR